MIVVDTSVWIDAFANRSTAQTEWLWTHAGLADLAVPDLVLFEVLRGARHDSAFRLILAELSKATLVACSSPKLAAQAASYYRTLRASGKTVHSVVDCLVAAFCLEGNHVLLHNDSDYDEFAAAFGLRIVPAV